MSTGITATLSRVMQQEVPTKSQVVSRELSLNLWLCRYPLHLRQWHRQRRRLQTELTASSLCWRPQVCNPPLLPAAHAGRLQCSCAISNFKRC